MKISIDKIKSIIKQSILKESNYLAGFDWTMYIDELKRIVHEIGDNEAIVSTDIESYHHFGDMSAIIPLFGYKNGEPFLMEVDIDLVKWLASTEMPWESIDGLDRELFKAELLDVFPGSSFAGNVLIINGKDSSSDYQGFLDDTNPYAKDSLSWWKRKY